MVVNERRLFILRDDGAIYGDGADNPLEELGLDIHLDEVLRAEKCWSTAGVKAYRQGARPNPVETFHRVVAVVDHYIDFDRSLGGQKLWLRWLPATFSLPGCWTRSM